MTTLINQQTNTPISTVVKVADTRRSRRKGLLGRDAMEPSEALILTPCCAIHTAFMRFAIDVVFIDSRGRVLKIVQKLRPWRMAIAPRAHAVIELAGGALDTRPLAVGDSVCLSGVINHHPPSG